MLCSNCSEKLSPIVAIDIDGTLGDYHGHFTSFAKTYLAFNGPIRPYDGSEKFKAWGCRTFGIDERTWHDIKLAWRQGGGKRSMPVYPYAAEMCRDVQAAGAELWITTTRPYMRLDSVDPDTRFWLAQAGITYHGLLYDADKYRVLAERVDSRRVVAVVDDLPQMYDAAEETFGPHVPILRRQTYNRAISRSVEHDSLHTITNVINYRIIKWEAENE